MTLDLLAALLLAHLVADFPLQANWIAHNKHDDDLALLAHVAIHGAVTAIAVAAAGFPTGDVVAAAVAVAGFHTSIDYQRLPIRWDQTAHLATLLVIWAVVG